MAEGARYHHLWSWHYVCLLLKVYFLRVMAYLDVYLSDHLRPKVRDDVRVERVRFPSREPGRYLTAYKYTPVNLPPGPQPVHVNVHGSGFSVSAFFGNSRWFCYKVASQLNCVVVDTDYRKAPEYPHPYPLLDIEDCVYWLLSQPERYDKDMITMSGFSAGGNLAMSSTNRLGRDIIKALVSFYAPIDATTEGAPIGIRDYPEPRETARSGTHLESWVFATFYRSYIPLHQDPGQPSITVLFLPMDRYPDYMLVASGRCDVMHEDSNDFYQKILKEGSPVQRANARFLSIPREDHAFDEQPKCPESVEWREKAYDASVATIRAAHDAERAKRTRASTT